MRRTTKLLSVLVQYTPCMQDDECWTTLYPRFAQLSSRDHGLGSPDVMQILGTVKVFLCCVGGSRGWEGHEGAVKPCAVLGLPLYLALLNARAFDGEAPGEG